jgi:hypothetical protein
MLRRTKGRLLLTLLVVTGLAGTVNDSSLSKKERKFAINLMKDTKAEIIKNVKGLSNSQLNFKSSSTDLSIKECIYSIVLSERNLWDLFQTSIKAPANPEKRSLIKMTDKEVIEICENSNNKTGVYESVEVKNESWETVDNALTDFRNKRAAHIRYINISTEDLRDHVVRMPFGWIDCYQLSLIIAAKNYMLIQQINEIKADRAFPKN